MEVTSQPRVLQGSAVKTQAWDWSKDVNEHSDTSCTVCCTVYSLTPVCLQLVVLATFRAWDFVYDPPQQHPPRCPRRRNPKL